MRHVKITSPSGIHKALFTKWVKQAAEFNQKQSVTKSASAKKKPAAKPARAMKAKR
jgi:hypothetical protein